MFCNSKTISRNYTNKLNICIKDEKFKILHFNTYVKKQKYYTTCWVYIQTHSFKKYTKINTTWKKSFFPKVLSKHASQPFHWLTTYFGKKKKYKVEKHHIYTTQWQEFLKKNTYKTILLEACAIKQRKIKLKFKKNQKITWKLERKSLNWERVSPRRLWIKRDWNLREKI